MVTSLAMRTAGVLGEVVDCCVDVGKLSGAKGCDIRS